MRAFLLRLILGSNVTVFVEKKDSNLFELEIADDKNRKKLIMCEVERATPIRYHLKGYLPF